MFLRKYCLCCTVNSTHIFAIIPGVEFLSHVFQTFIIVSRKQNISRLLHPVGNQCVKRCDELGKNPEEKENVELKNNKDEKLEISNKKGKRLRGSPVCDRRSTGIGEQVAAAFPLKPGL